MPARSYSSPLSPSCACPLVRPRAEVGNVVVKITGPPFCFVVNPAGCPEAERSIGSVVAARQCVPTAAELAQAAADNLIIDQRYEATPAGGGFAFTGPLAGLGLLPVSGVLGIGGVLLCLVVLAVLGGRARARNQSGEAKRLMRCNSDEFTSDMLVDTHYPSVGSGKVATTGPSKSPYSRMMRATARAR